MCGRVRRPNTWLRLPSRCATTRSLAHSRMPSTLSARNSSLRHPSACAVWRRSSSTSPWIRRRNPASVMRMNRHGCIRPTLGAACAACSSRARTSSGTTAPLLDGPVNGLPLRRAERVLAHAGQRRWHHRGVTRETVLITASELARRLAADAPVAILDVRWQLTEPDGRAAHERGHVPGAVYVSLEDELSDHTVSGRGRHPLPPGGSVEEAARRWGIRQGMPVVVYDDWNRAGSARAWWVLTAAGLADVRILDGGLAAWTAAGGALDTGRVTPEPGDVVVGHDDLYAGARPTLDAGDAAAL
ncbi:MAG: thiosulfate/3-mercaptopyruvate sulfurtransferase, partial [Mycobacterium sp.]|nr:thiosulfate/3-mercaptopyruvate sulfurtransferase [Mycobacterium sp.]